MAGVASNEEIAPIEDTGRMRQPLIPVVSKINTYAAVKSATLVRENCADPAATNGA
jgi:hypothetical protein